MDAHGALHVQRHIDAVNGEAVRVNAVGQRGNGGAHAAFGAADDLITQGLQIIEPLLVHQLDQLALAITIGRELGADITQGLVGLAQVLGEEIQHHRHLLATRHDLADGDAQAFLVAVPCTGRGRAADVHAVGGAGRVGHQAAGAKDGVHHGDVVEMAGTDPGVVADDRVALGQALHREALAHRRQGARQGAEEARDAALGLGELAAAGVEQAEGHVVVVAHHHGEGGTQKGFGHLVDDAIETAPQQTEADGVHETRAHAPGPAS